MLQMGRSTQHYAIQLLGCRDHMLCSSRSVSTQLLFITHSIPEAVFLSDRILVMSPSPGRILHEIKVDFPRPRPLELMSSPAFAEMCGDIRKLFNENVGERDG